jgi:DEAD/DEAH box helicase domain-containing protein
MLPGPWGAKFICPRCDYEEPLDLGHTQVDQDIKSNTYKSPSINQDFKQCISSDILDALGLEYLVYREDPVVVKKSRVKFKDLLLTLCDKRPDHGLCGLEMYEHQKYAVEALLGGRSIVVTASTGAGKTEIWVSYALSKQLIDKNFKVLAIYPTKALASDQTERISKYYIEAGFNVTAVQDDDVKIYYGAVMKYDGDVSQRIKDFEASRALVILTNPEIVLDILQKKSEHKLWRFVTSVKMIVIDELDYYGSKGATLLLHLIRRLVEMIATKPQVVILGATIRNVKAIKNFLLMIDLEVIGGLAPKPANYLYVVLGKKDTAKNLYGKLPMSQELSYEKYKEKFFEALLDPRARSYIDIVTKENESFIVDLVKLYQRCRETTLVFARSIREADKIGSSLDPNFSAVHHSKISKEVRSRIEKKAREGDVKVIITVKTLLQGVDIGYISRVIHIGLPPTLREFIQREGRKGRRVDVERTESIVLPIHERDLVILSEGLKSLDMWKSLEPEVLILNPKNDLLKLYDHKLGFRSLEYDEFEFIGVDRNYIDNKINMEFYETLKQYVGIPIYLHDPLKNEYEFERECSLREYIEEYQPGSIDIQTQPSLIVSTHDARNREPAILKVVPNATLSDQYVGSSIYLGPKEWRTPPSIKNAILEYERVCRGWGQKPDLLSDIKRRKLWSEVYTTLSFSGLGGFKLVKEYPILVRWYLESRDKRRRALDNGVVIDVYEVKVIDVFYKPRVKYPYKFFTYVYASDLDPNDMDLEKIIKGMGFLKAILRHKYGLPIDTIGYSFEFFSKLLKIWEWEPIGLLKSLRNEGIFQIDEDSSIKCEELIKDVKTYQIDEKLKLLLRYIDRYSFSEDVLADSKILSEIRRDAERMVHYLCNTVDIKLKGEIKLVFRAPKESILILDSAFDKISISLAAPELGINILEVMNNEEKNIAGKIIGALSMHPDVRYIVHYGLEDYIRKMIPAILYDKVINLAEKILSEYQTPISLGKIRAELTGKEDLIELQNEISSRHLLRERGLDEDIYRKFFRLRAETIVILYNLSMRYIVQ